jgi:hypothetical protein
VLLLLGLAGVIVTGVLLVIPVSNEYSAQSGRSEVAVGCGSVVFAAELDDPRDLEDCRDHRRKRGMIATGVAGLSAGLVVAGTVGTRRSRGA